MKIIRNRLIPVRGFKAMNFFGIVFVREDASKFTQTDYFHEYIHTLQMKDFCPFLPIGGLIFYIVYLLEWVWRCITPPFDSAYMDISFEKEAYEHQNEGWTYIENRKHFNQWRNKYETK